MASAVSALLIATGCGAAEGSREHDASSLYALVEGIDGVAFYPPLGPEPTPHGQFDATLLDGLSIVLESVGSDGGVTVLTTLSATTQPAVALLAEHERYWVNIRAADYLTDPTKTYRVRALLDGSELGTSVLDARIFEVLAWSPALPIGVQLRIEGTGAVRALPRTRHLGTPRHCTDGVRNKDETGVDCGGSCGPCPTCSDGIQNQGESGVDCGGPCVSCATCSDRIQNQGETGIDCGGPCAPCATCSDGIQNQGETGIDCGGVCGPCPCYRQPGYPLGTWSGPCHVNGGGSCIATFTFTTPTSGTVSTLGPFSSSAVVPGGGWSYAFHMYSGPYTSGGGGSVSADGCCISGTWSDSNHQTGTFTSCR